MSNVIQPSDSQGIKWTKLQAWVRTACINAGISVTGLSNISPGDSEGIKWAKLGAWMQALAEGIGSSTAATPVVLTTSRALAATDAGRYLYSAEAGAVVLTVPATGFTAGDQVDVFLAGVGTVSFVADGSTIISKDSKLSLSAQGSGAVLVFVGAGVWHLVGDLA